MKIFLWVLIVVITVNIAALFMIAYGSITPLYLTEAVFTHIVLFGGALSLFPVVLSEVQS